MIIKDDRTAEQKRELTTIIVGLDTFLSGWGPATKDNSYAGWACSPANREAVKHWVTSRSDMTQVRVVDNDYRPQRAAHYHIYTVTAGHPALRAFKRGDNFVKNKSTMEKLFELQTV